MKSKFLAAIGSSIVFCASASASDGTWTNTGGGSWNLAGTGNWSGGNVADGTGFTANFSTLNITADTTVSLTEDRTIGNLSFADTTTATAAGWILGGTGKLTLAVSTGAPTVTVGALGTGKNTSISNVIDGTAGLTKAGAGTLALSGASTYTGTTTISDGSLVLSGGGNRLLPTSYILLSSVAGAAVTRTFDIGSITQQLDRLNVSYNPNGGVTHTANVSGTGGTLKVAGAFDLNVTNSSSVTPAATPSVVHLNMAGLSNFEYTATANKVIVLGNGNARAATLSLGATSTLTALALDLQNGGTGGNTAKTSVVNLGQTNTFNIDTVNVLNNDTRDSATLQFRALTSPSLKIRATDGSSRANWNLATSIANNSVTTAAIVDLVTGVTGSSSLDALVGTLTIGQKTGTATLGATFSMGGGTLDATTISLGNLTGAGTLTSTLSVAGGTVKVGTLTFGTSTAGTLNSVLNLNSGGTLAAQTISNSGTATRTLNWNDGNISTYDTATDLTFASGVLVKLAATGTHTFDIGTGRTASVASVLADAAAGGTLVKAGAGSLVLSGVNTYTGNTTVSAGSLQLAAGAQLKFALGATSGSSNSISGAGTVTLDGSFNIDRTAALALASGSWTLENVASLTGPYGSGFSVAGFTDTGSNTWTLIDGAKNWVFNETTGVLTLTSIASHLSWSGSVDGNWDIGSSANWLNGASPSTYGGGDHATFDDTATGTTSIILNAAVTPETLVFNNTSKNYTVTGSGSIGGFGTFTKSGTGTVIIATTNTYSGGTTINAGVLQVGNGGTAGSLGSGAITNNGSLVFNRGDSLTVASVISGAGNFTQSGTGTTILSADNSYTGSTTISAGTLQVGVGGTTGTLGSTSSITNNGTLAFNKSSTVTLNQDVTGTGILAQSGTGILVLPLDMSYTGSTTINSGTLQLGTGGTTGSILSTAVTNNGNLGINRSDDVSFTAHISGSGGVTHSGSAILRLTGSNTYGGNTAVTGGGTLQLDSAGSSLPANTGLSVSNGAVDFSDTNLTLKSLSKPPSGTAIFFAEAGKTLTVTGGDVLVNQGTLALEALETFVMNQPTGSFSVVPTASGTAAAANMPLSNTITAASYLVGVNGPTGTGTSSTSIVSLMDTTVIQSDTIKIGSNGAQSGSSTLQTAPAAESSSVTIRGTSGGTSRANLTIGEKSGSDYAGGSGFVNFNSSGTSLDALIGTMIIGRHADGGGNFNNATSGGFSFNTGILDASSITMAVAAAPNNKTANGSLVTVGGTIRTNTLTMVQDSGGAMGTANIYLYSGGALEATSISGQAAANAIVNIEDGSLRNLAGTDLAVTNVKFQLSTSSIPAVSVQAGHTATLGAGSVLSYSFDSSAAIPATATITVTGALVLSGASLSLTDIAGSPVALPDGTKLVLATYSGGSVSGSFSGLAQGSTLTVGPNKFTVSYTDASSVTLTSSSGSPYDAWLASYGITPGGANTAAGDDYDNDGLDNMVEYMLNSNPAAGAIANLPVSTKSGSNLVFSYTRLKAAVAAGFIPEVEYSTTLGGVWTSALPGMYGTPVDNGTTESVTVTIPIPGGASGLFARLRVVKP